MKAIELIVISLLISMNLIAQDGMHSHNIEFVTDFMLENGMSASERLELQCEYNLLYEQYGEDNTKDSNDLLTAFQSILTTYRTTDTINRSYRLKEVVYDVSDSPRKSNELELIQNQQRENHERATTCQNSDFENGNFDNWSLGFSLGGGEGNISPGADIGTMNGTSGNHAIMGPGAGNDGPSGNNIPRVYPGGGQYSMRLGDQLTGYNAAKVSFAFTVTSATELFIYHYAVILQDPGHSPSEQPFLRINLIINGVSIPCGEYYQAASKNAPGYLSHGSVRYKPWGTVSIALTSFMGQTATIEFTTSDCSQGGHYGYAYIDAECSPMPDINGGELNCLNPTITLEGPAGADTYQWTGPGIVGSSTGKDVVVNAGGTYEVEAIPVQGPSCSYARQTIVVDKMGEVTADFNTVPDIVCLGEEINFEDLSVSDALAGNIVDYEWQFGDGDSSTVAEPSYTYNTQGTYSVQLIINSANGCLDTLTKDVVVSPIPVADFIIDSVCTDDIVTVQDLSSVDPINGNVISNWNWDFGDGQTATGSVSTHQYASENLYDVMLTVTTNNGCPNSVTKTTAIYPLPVADFYSSSECLGFANQFADESTVSNNHTPNNITEWNWDFDDGNTGNTQNVSHAYSVSGLYNTELTVTTDHGCTGSIVLPVTVYEPPVVDFDFINACDNEDVLLTSTSTANASGNLNYFWDVDNDNTTDYTVNPVGHTYNHDGSYDVRLIVENSNDCLDTIVKEVTVYALPHANFDVDAVCEDTTTTFTNTSTINPVDNDVIKQYEWSFGNGASSTTENPTLDYGTENIYNAKLVITTNYGCKDSIEQPVTVYPLPVVDFSPTEVCLEFDTHFTDESTVSNDHTSNHNVAWAWDFADGYFASVVDPVHTYQSDGIFNTVLTVTTNHNCVASATIPVTVYPKPVASYTGINLEGCAPICPTVTSTSTINNPSSITNYQWTLSDGKVYEGSSPSFSDCYENETGKDIYYGLLLTVTSDKGCVDQHSESNYISVYHNPVASFYTTPDKPDIIDPTVKFHNTSLYANTYSWTIDYYGQTGEVDPIVKFPPDSASYYAMLIAYTDKGCTDTARTVVKILDRLIFYVPNTFTPDHDDYNEIFKPIFSSGYDPKTYTLYIFNRWGELIFESHDTNIGWDGTYGGKLVKDGTYVWKIDIKTSMNDEHKTFVGHVNVLK